jgi:hypothetical protein
VPFVANHFFESPSIASLGSSSSGISPQQRQGDIPSPALFIFSFTPRFGGHQPVILGTSSG